MIPASILLALALSTPDAAAATDTKIKNVRITQSSGEGGSVKYKAVVIVPNDDADPVTDVEVELSSGETLTLEAEDTHLPLTGFLDALPEVESSLELDLFDAKGNTLATLAGSLDRNGQILFGGQPANGDNDDAVECSARTGCEDTDGRDTSSAYDLEVLGAFIVDGDDGLLWSLVIDGADALDVASATLVSTESFSGDKVCAASDEKGNCLKWTTETWSESTESSLDAGEGSWAWSADLPDDFDPDGVTLKAKVYGADGKKLDSEKVDAVLPWGDEGVGQTAQALDEDPWTWISFGALDVGEDFAQRGFTVLSEGWTLDDDYPVDASIELDGGETWELPAHSYQTTVRLPLSFTEDPTGEVFALEQDGIHLATYNSIMKCDADAKACGKLGQDELGDWYFDLVVYAEDPADLPTTSKLRLTPTKGKAQTTEDSYEVDFAEEFAVTFAIPVDFTGNPVGEDLDLEARLYGVPDKKGKQDKLAKGKATGAFGVDEDGDLVIFDNNGGTTTSRGDILIGGEPIGIERTVGDEPVPLAPPAIVFESNGRGTRNTSSNSQQTQQAELL